MDANMEKQVRGGVGGGGGRGRLPGGFTLVELMAAMFITVIMSGIIVLVYNTSMQSYYRTERQLQSLSAFRSTTDRLEREVNSIVTKATFYPTPIYRPGFSVAFWDTRAKYLHGDAWVNGDPYAWTLCNNSAATVAPTPPVGGSMWTVNPDGRSLYKINFRPRYLGYYSTLDGYTIDRTEWYFNPPEDKQVWANGLDDDGDDPDGDAGLRILYDDRGCLMLRKRFDKDMAWREWDNPVADGPGPNEYRDPYHGPFSRADFPPQQDEIDGPVVLADTSGDGNYDVGIDNDGDGKLTDADRIDTGTVVGENFTDLRFYYVYKHPEENFLRYADYWPPDDDNDPTNTNNYRSSLTGEVDAKLNLRKRRIECRIGGRWAQWPAAQPYGVWPNASTYENFDIAYFTLPMAISARFTFQVGTETHVYEKLIYLHASRWLKWVNP
jgi:type II secretory pathway pseudopilin PulG